ncbi:MAG: HAD family hydrolase [Thermoplasmatota archaeon]
MDGVLFDLFGTIIPRPKRKLHDNFMNDLARVSGVDKSRFREIWMSTYHDRCTHYGTDTDSMMSLVLRSLDVPTKSEVQRRMTSIWEEMTLSHFRFFDDVVPALRYLRGKGFKIGLLTNCGPNVPEIVERSEVGPFLDSATYSTIEGVMKPDRRIFEKACSVLGTVHSRTVFIGDGDNYELEGSSGAGIKAVKIDRGEIAGDYRITEDSNWDPTIKDLWDIGSVLQDL